MKIFALKKSNNSFYTQYQITIFDIVIAYKQFSKNYNTYFKQLKKYKEKKKDNITRRLFLTSGNLSLINALAIINQKGLNKNSENSILIWSHISNQEFEEVSTQISHLTKIKKLFKFCNCTLDDLFKYFINNHLAEYDEIYLINCRYMFLIKDFLFPNIKYYIFDEGVCVLFKHKGIDYSDVKKCFFIKYLDKIDFLGADNELNEKIEFLDKREFLKVSQSAAELYPIGLNLNPEDKNIILCGTGEGCGFWSFDEIFNYQNKIIDDLNLHGYNVLFKPHPRDKFKYQEKENFRIINTKLPLECYDLKDKCLAVVSLFSSVSAQMYSFHNIPGFCAHGFINDVKDIGIKIVKYYSPSYEMLLSIDVKTKTFNEVQNEILSLYTNFLNKKTLMSQNSALANNYAQLPPPPPCISESEIRDIIHINEQKNKKTLVLGRLNLFLAD